MLVRYEQLERTVAQLERRALRGFTGAGALGVVNLLPYRRRGLIEAPGFEPAVVELAGFSARPIELAAASDPPGEPPSRSDGAAIESDRLRVEAMNDGTVTVLHKTTGRRFEQLHRFEDELDAGDLYNFCPVQGSGIRRSSGFAGVRVLRDGPVVHELELSVTAPLTATTVVRLVQGSPRVEFRTTIENETKDHRLRVVFPAGGAVNATYVRAEGQFALVHRALTPPAPRTAWVEPPDPTQHTLGAVALGPLALLTKGLPEYEARPGCPAPGGADPGNAGPELCLTLLRAVGLISRPSGWISTRPLGAGPQTETPDGQCLGVHELEYALLLNADELDDTALLRASQDYRYGLVIADGPGVYFDPPLTIEGEVVFSCLKGAEDGDGLILRVFNPGSEPARIDVAGAFSVSRTRLDETGRETPETADLAPGEIGTFRLRVAVS
jgi:hypothetical protein